MNEVWKDIEGYEGLYQVSNLGRVKSLDREVPRGLNSSCISKGKILKPHLGDNGYLYINLCRNGKRKVGRIHILVAKAFIPNHGNNNIVNHLDGKKLNNCSDNLEWTTKRLNEIHASKLGLLKRSDETKKKISDSKKVPVIGRNLSTGEIIRLDGMHDGKKLGFTVSGIFDCCKGRQSTHRGFAWQYENK